MEYEKASAYIISRLRNELAAEFTYHSPEHTLGVIESAEMLGRQHNLSADELILLKTAAAYHDSGFLNSVQNHEQESCRIAREVLPQFGYSNDHIGQIEGMIMATKIPQQPNNTLEKIICDADLIYLGEEEYKRTSNNLRKELEGIGMSLDDRRWLEMQIGFLESHHYWTRYGKRQLNPGKQKVLQDLKANTSS